MDGAKRAIAFCCLAGLLPIAILITGLHLRFRVYKDLNITVAEAGVFEIKEGISTIFCQAHNLRMNSTFNAFQFEGNSKFSTTSKHLRLRKSITLVDDTFEYWGFYLPRGSIVNLLVCSRYKGASVLVVKGEKQFRTCVSLNLKSSKSNVGQHQEQVKVNFDSVVEETNNLDVDGKNNSIEFDEKQLNDLKISAYQIINKRLKKRIRRHIRFNPTEINHGNLTEQNNSVPSFEASLFHCYDGLTIDQHEFPLSSNCTDTNFLLNSLTMSREHNVLHDGYYYYIFYNNNSMLSNDLHATFYIQKPALHHFNYMKRNTVQRCINQTECTFNLTFSSDDYKVIVEVPTGDGIEHQLEDPKILISRCVPRENIYVLFSVLILLCIICFSFI